MNQSHPRVSVGELLRLLAEQTVAPISHPNENERVQAVTSDSREVRAGTVFVAIAGTARDAHDFIPDVQRAGASLVIGQKEADPAWRNYLRVRDSRRALACLAAHFAGNPSRDLLMIGVTGTSGKTTITYVIESILGKAGHNVGVIGTVNFRQGGQVIPSTHTTPGPVELQALLGKMKSNGCTAVVMEVSSHALKQCRAHYVAFDGMVFTNLSPEHLDFHPDMEDYFASKAILFTDLAAYARTAGKNPRYAVNADDEYGRRLVEQLRARGEMQGTSFSVAGLQIDMAGIRGAAGNVQIRSPLTGAFNASNLLAAVSICQELGVDRSAIERGIDALRVVPGRLERVENERGIHILVDYAHKPDALEKVLRTLAEVRGSHRILTVFGCGGDRDRTKRPVMGRLAARWSDYVYVTSDNPRTEKPEAILAEIIAGMAGAANYEVEPDRKKAIVKAIREARAGDLVLIAGKGHEDYQIIADPKAPGGTRKIHFDDREVAREALTFLDTGF